MDPSVKFPKSEDVNEKTNEWLDDYETALIELRMVIENIPRIPENLRTFKKLYYLAHGELPENIL